MYKIMDKYCCFCSQWRTKDRESKTFVAFDDTKRYSICLECSSFNTEIYDSDTGVTSFEKGIRLPNECLDTFKNIIWARTSSANTQVRYFEND
jgi:hypothetical protein